MSAGGLRGRPERAPGAAKAPSSALRVLVSAAAESEGATARRARVLPRPLHDQDRDARGRVAAEGESIDESLADTVLWP